MTALASCQHQHTSKRPTNLRTCQEGTTEREGGEALRVVLSLSSSLSFFTVCLLRKCKASHGGDADRVHPCIALEEKHGAEKVKKTLKKKRLQKTEKTVLDKKMSVCMCVFMRESTRYRGVFIYAA